MQTNNTLLAIWLMPQAKDLAELNTLITKLAQKENTSNFEAHITAFAGTSIRNASELNRTKLILSQVAPHYSPIEATVNGIKAYEAYFRSVVIKLKVHPELTRLNQELHARIDPTSTYEFEPHLSLHYSHVTLDRKQEIAKKLQIKKSTLTLDTLAINLAQPGEATWNNVTQWRTVYQVRLTG